MDALDDNRIRTFGLLLEAHARLTRLLDDELRDADQISLQTFEVLLRLGRAERGHRTMSELAEELALTTGGVTRLADRLEQAGLVRRGACPGDRRVVRLSLTDEGHSILVAALDHHLDALDRHVMQRVDAADLSVLERVLDTLRSDPSDGSDEAPAA